MAKVFFRAIQTRPGYPKWPNLMEKVEITFDAHVKPELRSYFTRVTELWDHPVRFEARKKVTSKRISLYVGPTGANAKIWIWATLGTKKRDIAPRTKPYLRFQLGYKARTSPGYHYRGPGKSVGPWVTVKKVKDHEIKPRNFEKHIKRFYQPKFCKHMEDAVREGARLL